MVEDLENNRMTREEIRQLMALKGWTVTQLAARLDLSKDAVARWLGSEHPLKGPASILMRQWLEQARAQARGFQLPAPDPAPPISPPTAPEVQTA
jgi:transcriptional regulator with XRE-family HTH domain